MGISANRHTNIVVVVLFVSVLLVTFFAYLGGLTGPLLLDDFPQLQTLIGRSGEQPALLLQNYLISTSGPLGRPVSMLTFVFDAVAHGPDIWWWKYHSLMLHLMSGVLLLWLTGLLVTAGWPNAPASPWLIGVVVVALWLLHPIQVSTVLYTVQRMTILSSLFVFAGLGCYLKGRLLQPQKETLGWILIAVALLLFLPLAALSKESGLLLVPYCFLAELVVLRFHADKRLGSKLLLLHGLLLSIGLIALIYLLFFSGYLATGYASRDFTIYERLLTEARVLTYYLKLILLPFPHTMGFFHDDFTVSTGLFSPLTTGLALASLALLFVGSYWCRDRFPLVAFGVLFFGASHLLESTVFGLELVFEHRNYIGSAGIILALFCLATSHFNKQQAIVAAAVILIGYTFLTVHRVEIWSTGDKMYRHMYAVHPESDRLNYWFANVVAESGEFESARAYLARIDSGTARDLNEMYLDCLENGAINQESLTQLISVAQLTIDPFVTTSVDMLVGEISVGTCSVDKLQLLDVLTTLEVAPSHSQRDNRAILFAKADLLKSMNRIDDAVGAYTAAQELSSEDAMPTYRAADLLAQSGQFFEAREMLRRAGEVERRARIVRPDVSSRIYSGVAEAYIREGDTENALSTYEQALHVLQSDARTQIEYAELLQQMGLLEKLVGQIPTLVSMSGASCCDFDFRLQQILEYLDIHTSSGLAE